MSGESRAIALAEKVLVLLETASFSSTYKYALLTAILDLCMERTEATGAPPTTLTTRELAIKTVELYWPHATPFAGDGLASPRVLRQGGSTGGSQAEILRHIETFRAETAEDSLGRARRANPERFERLVWQVEWKLIEMPIPRLQSIGKQEVRFLYEYDWGQDIRQRAVSDYQRHGRGDFDNRLLLQPGVAEDLVRLNGVLRPLLRREWARMVSQFNSLPDSKLEDFLFGMDRQSLVPVREPIRELQDGRCFYCDEGLRADVEVDHFIPWARYPDNGLDNLVVAHARCNNNKRDFFAAADHVDRWAERNRSQANDLSALAQELSWDRDSARTRSVAVAMYARLSEDVRLWKGRDVFVPNDRARILEVLRRAA